MLKRTHGRRLDPTNTFAEVEVIHPDGRKEWMPDTQVDEINRRAAAPKPTLPGSVEDRLSALERRVKASDAMVESSVGELQEGSFDGLAKADDLDALTKRVEALEALATAPESETTPKAEESPKPARAKKKG